MAASTSTLRYPGYMHNDLVGLVASLVPTPRLHFLQTAFTPITAPGASTAARAHRQASLIDVMKSLLDSSNALCSPTGAGKYISALNIIEGPVDPAQLHKSLARLREKRSLSFIEWGPATLQVALSRGSPIARSRAAPVSGLMLANNTNVRSVFEVACQQFDKLFRDGLSGPKPGAYLQNYIDADCLGDNLEGLTSARETVRDLISEYEAAARPDYPEYISQP
eukprot:gnl/Ergobibamus_cyprinoides/1304.p1 GENE.gnl/Ergobibamus_cyprinoides/1304~~gnl/Ergobibamus_cyprinoides/1304.p1  ORF type:complete len:260 (+),score=56.62 gnl/Ergobibamus_cyprinoides/1304:113-781(+)